MVHISPWEAKLGLIKGAAAILPSDSRCISTVRIYAKESHRSEQLDSTGVFAIAIRLGSSRPRSGRRDGAIRWIFSSGYSEMPANNLSVVFRRFDRVAVWRSATERSLSNSDRPHGSPRRG